MEGIIFPAIMVILLVLAIIGYSANKKMKAQARAMGAIACFPGIALHGIPHVPAHSGIDLFLLNDKLTMKEKNLSFDLPLEQVQAATALSKTDLLTKDKSIIARGVVGGVLLGPLGAIVGGMTGIGKKNVKGSFLVINYRPKESESIEVIIINMLNMMNAKKLADDITKQVVQRQSNNGTIVL
ncbi:hypothetical protein [Brevibacillus formosus]|uniref:hypothetical protein n=1 Tax=Brevibacillus formosus TaxID=54913 RepID=UPI003F1AFA77